MTFELSGKGVGQKTDVVREIHSPTLQIGAKLDQGVGSKISKILRTSYMDGP